MIDYLKKFSLENKTAVVCGGLGLIGKEVSIALAQAKAKVIILDINENEGKSFKEKHQKKDLDMNYLNFDITKPDEYEISLKKIIDEFKKIDIWINLAYPRTKDWSNKIENVTNESWFKNVEIQMNSYCLITKEVAEYMKNNKIKGTIINYGSTYGVIGPDFEIYKESNMTCPAAYSAIKGGIINFSRYVASYYGKYNIRVNSLCPGGIFDNQNKKFVEEYERRTPLRRMGNADEIASATLFLASEAASYITGATIMVDGGWTTI